MTTTMSELKRKSASRSDRGRATEPITMDDVIHGDGLRCTPPVGPAGGFAFQFGHGGCHWSAPYRRATLTDAVCASPRSVAAPMMRENTAWCSQRGVALVNITLALFA